MKVKHKRVILPILVFAILMISHGTVFVYGFGNDRVVNESSIDPDGGNVNIGSAQHENRPVNYLFEDNYGVHDWIADSAVRLIANSENQDYQDKIKWLYDDNVELNKFDDVSNAGSSYAKWFQKKSFHPSTSAWYKARRYASFLHGTGWPDFRRMAVLKDPDSTVYTRISIQDINAPRNERHISQKVSFNSGSHSYTFKWVWIDKSAGYPNGVFYPENQAAGRAASRAGKEAVDFLAYQRTLADGTTQRIPKYEAASIALGAMAHYIGDLANPAHTYKSYQFSYNHKYGEQQTRVDTAIDYYGYQKIGDRFISTNFPNGGPDWNSLDPETLKVNGNPLKDPVTGNITGLTHTHNPYYAAMQMAYLTHTGYDDDNVGDDSSDTNKMKNINPEKSYYGEYAAFSLSTLNYKADFALTRYDLKYVPYWSEHVSAQPYDSEYEAARQRTRERVEVLLKWAVYWTACAILWVSYEGKLSDDTTSDRETVYDIVQVGFPKPRQFVSDSTLQEQVDKSLADTGSMIGKSEGGWRVAASLSLLVPIMAILIVPGAMRAGLELHRTPEKGKEPQPVNNDVQSYLSDGATV